MMPLFPARPANGGYLTPTKVKATRIYRPKLNGDRVVVNTETEVMFNRHGERYSKGRKMPFDELRKAREDLNIDSPWVDVEWLDKIKHWKGKVTILDFPWRGESFHKYMGRWETLGFKEFVDSIPTIRPIRPDSPILVLPWWFGNTYTVDRFLALKEIAKTVMKRNQDKNPSIEGLVAVEAHSDYPIQIASPDRVTSLWVKHRFG